MESLCITCSSGAGVGSSEKPLTCYNSYLVHISKEGLIVKQNRQKLASICSYINRTKASLPFATKTLISDGRGLRASKRILVLKPMCLLAWPESDEPSSTNPTILAIPLIAS